MSVNDDAVGPNDDVATVPHIKVPGPVTMVAMCGVRFPPTSEKSQAETEYLAYSSMLTS